MTKTNKRKPETAAQVGARNCRNFIKSHKAPK